MTITPVTLKQIIQATLDNPSDTQYKVDGKDLFTGRLVVRVVAIEDEASQTKLSVIDGSYETPIELTMFTTQVEPGLWQERRALL
jgi:hypothetical protein